MATHDGQNQCLSLRFLARPLRPHSELTGQHSEIMIVPELIGELLEQTLAMLQRLGPSLCDHADMVPMILDPFAPLMKLLGGSIMDGVMQLASARPIAAPDAPFDVVEPIVRRVDLGQTVQVITQRRAKVPEYARKGAALVELRGGIAAQGRMKGPPEWGVQWLWIGVVEFFPAFQQRLGIAGPGQLPTRITEDLVQGSDLRVLLIGKQPESRSQLFESFSSLVNAFRTPGRGHRQMFICFFDALTQDLTQRSIRVPR